jgi:hypothetical protein
MICTNTLRLFHRPARNSPISPVGPIVSGDPSLMRSSQYG